jgi:hypothetical protein
MAYDGKAQGPKKITLIFLPSRSPELSPVEHIWQYLRANWLTNSVFEICDAIIDAACDPWPAHRPTGDDHIYRHAQLGAYRSISVAVGIMGLDPRDLDPREPDRAAN